MPNNNETIAMGGVYRGSRYLGVAFSDGDLTIHGTGFKYDYHYNPERKEWYKTLIKRMRRGRQGLNRMIFGKRILKHRWERQVMSI